MSSSIKFRDVTEIESHYKLWARGHFFDQDSKRFFGSRLLGNTYGPDGSIFVESTWDGFEHTGREYKVRRYVWNETPNYGLETRGTIETLETHPTRARAITAAKRLGAALEVAPNA